ncbi:MAG: Lrp/AsnC family transcriptional regulator, partial [Candidatus Heimdallarchaeota archaeon]
MYEKVIESEILNCLMSISFHITSILGHEVDEQDFEILKILDRNCRVSYSKIAELVNLPLRNVSTRIENLITDNVIKRFTVQFNYGSLGYRHYIGSIHPQEGKKFLFKELQLIPEIYRIWELIDETLTISFFCRNAKHLEEVLNNIIKTGAELNNYTEARIFFPLDIPYSITDWQIIFYLLNNSRASKKEIAQSLTISEKTVNRRIKRMRNMKLISFIPEIDFEAISGIITAVISLETVGPSKQTYLNIKEDKSIKYWRSAGSVTPSIVLFVYGKSIT